MWFRSYHVFDSDEGDLEAWLSVVLNRTELCVKNTMFAPTTDVQEGRCLPLITAAGVFKITDTGHQSGVKVPYCKVLLTDSLYGHRGLEVRLGTDEYVHIRASGDSKSTLRLVLNMEGCNGDWRFEQFLLSLSSLPTPDLDNAAHQTHDMYAQGGGKIPKITNLCALSAFRLHRPRVGDGHPHTGSRYRSQH